MPEYIALQTLTVARNYDGIAHAQAEKPKRQIDRDVLVPEQPLYVESADHPSGGGEGQIENLPSSKATTLGLNVHLAHRFDDAALSEILAFNAADRKQAFVRGLETTSFMQDGHLPLPFEDNQIKIRREHLSDVLSEPFRGLAHLGGLLEDVIARQRTYFGTGQVAPRDEEEDDEDDDVDAPPVPGKHVARDATAIFAPSDAWRLPSDYVAFLTQRFENEWINPRTKKKERRPLKRDQALFVTYFAYVCNTVWKEDRKVEDGELAVEKMKCFSILLMGQGGSGKTAIVQEIVLPTMDFLFGTETTLIVCSKWSQAENISTAVHKALL